MTGRRPNIALALACVALVMTACAGRVSVPAASPSPRLPVYVGTYTGDGSEGIYRFTFDAASGDWTEPLLAAESENPSFLALRPDGRVLYAVNELGTFRGSRTGAVSAFAIDAATGSLTLLNQVASGGADPCHVIVDSAAKNVLVANYSGGTVAVFPITEDGRLRDASALRHHAGSGPNKARQASAHAHEIVLDPAERFALAVDLGADRIFVYRYAAADGTLEPNEPPAAALDPGSGPRHVAWHPSGAVLYAISELRSTVTAFHYDAGSGTLEAFQTITTLPPGFSGENTAAEVVISPDGRFLYASNRGDDSLAVFKLDERAGALTPAGHFPTGGRGPRHFAIDPSGRWLLVANQQSNSINIFRLDATTGRLEPAGRPLAISKPVCIVFAPQP